MIAVTDTKVEVLTFQTIPMQDDPIHKISQLSLTFFGIELVNIQTDELELEMNITIKSYIIRIKTLKQEMPKWN